MALNKIKNNASWGESASSLNSNFESIEADLTKVKNATTRCKGYFISGDELKTAYPSAHVGDYAYIGTAYPFYIWKWNGSSWGNTGNTGGDQDVNLENYYNKTETDAKLSELGSYVSNPEYVRAYTDAEGKFLWGIKQDGSIEWAKGVPTPVKKYIESLDLETDEEVERINQLVIGLLADVKVLTDTHHYISNPEWACAIVDSEERILMGIKADGSYYIPNREMYHVESNPEFAKVVVDVDGRVLFGIRADGSCYIPKGVSEEARKGLIELTSRIGYFENIFSNVNNPEWIQVTTDAEGKVLEGIDAEGKKFFPKQEMIEKYNDIEGRTEMTLDADGKILSYRDAKGTKHEESMIINKHLILGKEAMSELQSALRESGFSVKSPIDWSGKSFVEIPMPRCAIANFSNIDRMPTSKTANAKAYMEVWDMNGNYFKVKAITNTQGDSSTAFAKKNFGIDICSDTDDWVGDETVTVKFGDWVSQDSFHLKAYATDTFRCSGAVCYKLYNQIMMSRGLNNDRPYKQYYVGKSTTTNASGKINQDVETNARCVPDGFPVILYLNGEFYGVYSWQLKKHRDNYQMKKSNAKHIHLDGTITAATLFDGKIDWTAFEVRNPKSLIDMDGNKYDGDNPTELSNTDEFSSEVKSYIVNLSNYISQLRAKRSEYENGSIDIDELKNYIEEKFDIPSIIDYALFSNIVGNFDGLAKNWQYITYDGVKWFIADYDNDGTFGNYFNGNMIMAPEDTLNKKYEVLLGNSTALPSGWMYAYYKGELRARYSELKEKGILTKDNIVSIFREWMSAVGADNYDREYTKWKNQPCYRDPLINDEYWELSTYTEAVDTPEIYDETKQYNIGDYVRFKDYISTVYFVFKCKKANIGQSVITGIYESEKPSFGHYDSIYRISNWIDKRIEVFENLLTKL